MIMKERGFTLLEVLVAIAILALVATLVWSSQSVVFSASRRLTKKLDMSRMGHLSIAKLEADLRSAYLFATPVHLGGGDRGEQWVKTEFVGLDAGEHDSVRFTSFAHQRLFKEARESDQAQIAYRIGSRDIDGERTDVLERNESDVTEAHSETSGKWVPVAEGVTALDLQYWNPQTKEWKAEWNSTGVDNTNRLPGAVRITLKLADPEDPKRIFTYTGMAMIAMAPGPNDF